MSRSSALSGRLADVKRQIRETVLARRDAAGGGSSEILCDFIKAYAGRELVGYLPIRSEMDPRPAMGVSAGVPVVVAKRQPLRFSRWTPETPLREGAFKVQVPEVDDFFEPDVLIVPMVAFTRAGDRLGYGGGFYDRTLEALRAKRETLAIGFAHSVQEVETLPLEDTDQRMDVIVTEREVIWPD